MKERIIKMIFDESLPPERLQAAYAALKGGTLQTGGGGSAGIDPLLKSDEVCRILGVSRTKLWRQRRKGLAAVHIDRALRFRTSDLKKYLESLPSADLQGGENE